MKSRLSLFFASALLCASAVNASQLVDLSVIDRDTGSTLPVHSSDSKLYIAGKPGHRYSVRLTNRTGQRIMTVLSVDGVNAVSGETANPSQSGYVLDPYQSTEVLGWRKSMDEIAQFNFTALSDSYAARTGRANNVGVIGVAVFREQVPQPPRDKIALSRREDDEANTAAPPVGKYREYIETERQAEGTADQSSTKAPASTAAPGAQTEDSYSPYRKGFSGSRSQPKEESLGTGHGAHEYSHVVNTTFQRESSTANEVLSIYYDSYRNLVARGIIPVQHKHSEPEPFPSQFVPDPVD